ncbi:RNA demethylase ALKBH9B-like isoform X2 [Henckelia pumila]|uniref:RNA demethylase ALKBH9B-like isoform X2 n=1 Tax=Henckelia pumila TaxID=405737 RepID=UPI003C6E850B
MPGCGGVPPELATVPLRRPLQPLRAIHLRSHPIPSRSFIANSRAKRSWADMYHADEHVSSHEFANVYESCEEIWIDGVKEPAALSMDEREYTGFCNVRKKDFELIERVNGEFLNVVDGLELHTGVFSVEEQKRIVSHVEWLKEMGRKRLLRERTYSAPRKWMRGKGRITLQFGCCYNYATDKSGNPPGILRNEIADPIPELFKSMIKRLVRWHVLPEYCVPDSCIVNIYEEGDCIPPHIDNHDFVRPFCTVSFLRECEILFGSNLKIVGAGEFSGSLAVPLPVGSVLVINGNGADVAKHCVPAVPARRISITFRKMHQSKLPVGYAPEPDLIGLQPLSHDPVGSPRPQQSVTYATTLNS